MNESQLENKFQLLLGAEDWRIRKIFTPPTALQKWVRALSLNTRFVHYTNADAASKIISQKKIWMRNALCMNDYSEIRYGIDRVMKFIESDAAKPCWSILESARQGSADEFKKNHENWLPDLETKTYVTCISEHDSSEDLFGRLSMWRCYAGQTGVALVINNTAMMSPTDVLDAYSFPVLYMTDEQFQNEMESIVANISNEADFIRTMEEGDRSAWLLFTLQSLAYSLKHPGFHEEKEWRVVYRPSYSQSSVITPTLATVSGVPQPIYELPLTDFPDQGLTGLSPPTLVDRIIIGPTEYPLAMFEAFSQLLADAGVPNAKERVFISDIPVRL